MSTSVQDYSHPIFKTIASLIDGGSIKSNMHVLQIGCGEGSRLKCLADKWGASVYGIDPSAKAVALAKTKGINAIQGTADDLPFESGKFDLVMFGFCLYLCDREDLFQIAGEADRVLSENSWLIIHDFYSERPVHNPYNHREGLYSYKMDYRKLFDWHPAHTCFSHLVQHHQKPVFTDSSDDWVATSLLRKYLPDE